MGVDYQKCDECGECRHGDYVWPCRCEFSWCDWCFDDKGKANFKRIRNYCEDGYKYKQCPQCDPKKKEAEKQQKIQKITHILEQNDIKISDKLVNDLYALNKPDDE